MPPTLPPGPSPFWGGGIMASSRARGTRAPVSQVRLEGRGEIEHARTPRARGARAHARAESLRGGAGAGVARNRFAVARSRSFASFVERFDETSAVLAGLERWCVCGDLS